MRSGYSYLDGMQELLQTLAADDFEIHAFTNYPIWFPSLAFHSLKRSFMSLCLLLSCFHRYNIIEDKLKLSAYLSWTFCSCIAGTSHISCLFLLLIACQIQTIPTTYKAPHVLYLSGKRKPDPEFYLEVVGHLGVEPCDCIFIDDRL